MGRQSHLLKRLEVESNLGSKVSRFGGRVGPIISIEGDDGHDDNMNCAQSSGSYVLICQSFYNMAFAGTDIPMLGILLAVAVLVILCLSIYIVKLKKVIRYQQNIDNKNKDKKQDCEETQKLSF